MDCGQEAMRAILFLLAVLSTNAMAGVLVIGDSMSAQVNSWPAYYREYTGDNVMVMAQNGRTIRDFTMPNGLVAMPNVDKVIYFLGTNDRLAGIPQSTIASRSLTQLRFLKDRGFTVTVVLMPGDSVVNRVLRAKAKGLRMGLIDLSPIWDNSLTYDGIHPKPELSRMIAQCVITALGQ